MQLLEARITALEAQATEKAGATANRLQAMATCLENAEQRYWNYVKLNGRRRAKLSDDGNEVWNAPTSVWDQASKLKQNAIGECQALFGRQ
jgi:hypothetical protein